MSKFREWICKKFGHNFDLVEFTMMKIQNSALNSKSFENEAIMCKRCKSHYKWNKE